MQHIEPETHLFTTGPNNKELPVLLYRQVMADEEDKVEAFQYSYKKNNWTGLWQDTIYTYRHLHTNAHEALGIAEGSVRIELGGETGRAFDLKAGDCIVLPAGTIHKRLSEGKVVVVGAYPEGQQNYNIHKDVHAHGHDSEINTVSRPVFDPLYGKGGPLVKLWQARG